MSKSKKENKKIALVIISIIIVIVVALFFIFKQQSDEYYLQKLNEITQIKTFGSDSIFKEGENIIKNIKNKNSAIKEITNFYKSWAGYTYNQGKVDTSIALIEKALQVNPNDVVLITKYGFYLFHTGNNDLAVANWKKALEIDPTFTQVYVNLITYYLREKFDIDSLDYFVKTLQKVDPNYPISQVVRDTLKYFERIK